MRKLVKMIPAMLMAFFLLGASTMPSAHAKTNKSFLSPEGRARAIAFLEENGVQPETIVSLLNKLDEGKLPDSDMPGKQPVRTETIEGEGGTQKKLVFADGSIKVSTLTLPDPKAKDVSGGRWQVGTGYRNCYGANVSEGTFLMKMNFMVDFSAVQYGRSEILKVYNEDFTLDGGTVTKDVLSIDNRYSSHYSPARASYAVNYTAFDGSISVKYRLQFIIEQGGKYYSTANLPIDKF